MVISFILHNADCFRVHPKAIFVSLIGRENRIAEKDFKSTNLKNSSERKSQRDESYNFPNKQEAIDGNFITASFFIYRKLTLRCC